MREQLNAIMAKHTNRTAEEIAKDTDRDYWMTAEESAEYGLIDTVQHPRPKLAAAKS